MRIKLIIFAFAALSILVNKAGYAQAKDHPAFSDYPAHLYQGRLKIPSYYHSDGDTWRDDLGKTVDAPHVNLGGRFFAAAHSCGMDCRYFTISDLRSGEDGLALSLFNADEQHRSVTNDGRSYVTELITRADSFLFLARDHIESDAINGKECRERYFVLENDGNKVLPISRTFPKCSA
ncbi:hypothetical protein [Caballeronia fortuita]|uniref:hypothetical protein n=1 Tax=Caballeronia fortuita TaxID=1777138 RepID=UPI0009EECC4D|nr:hypothetical protein [Caballeronia fortuita]